MHHLLANRDQVDELVDQAVRAELDTTDLQISDLDNRQAAYRYYKEQLATLDPTSIEFTPIPMAHPRRPRHRHR